MSPSEPLIRGPRRHGWPRVQAALLGLIVLPLTASHGGFYPTAWGWAALALLWGAAMALALRPRLEVSRLELAMLAAVLGLFGWILASMLWTGSVSRTVLEAQRVAVYVGAICAAVVLIRPGSYRVLLGATLCANTLVCGYALATRLFPERLATINLIAGYRLSEPLGYWNALGVFAAMGALLALGLAAHGRGRVTSALAASSLTLLLPTLYFTFSRGAWIAFGCGLIAALALDPRRLRSITALLVVGPWAAAGVWIGSRSLALTRNDAPLEAATAAGHRLALVLVALAAGAFVTAFAFAALAPRVGVPRMARTAYAVTLGIVALGLAVGLFARHGSPVTLAEQAVSSFTSPRPVTTDGDLNRQFLTLSSDGRIEQWDVALSTFRDHPWLGSGAGTYEQGWLADRRLPAEVLDAHSVYLETLAELGPIGLVLVLLLLGLPLAAAVRARHHPLVAAAFGAFVVYAVHAGGDWDWEMTGVTTMALWCAGALLVCARDEARSVLVSGRLRAALLAVVVAVGAVAFVGLVANTAVSASATAAEDADAVRAAGRDRAAADRWRTAQTQARRAGRWAPWSTDPLRASADAQLLRGRLRPAADGYRRALAKEPGDWSLWFALARATGGREQRTALREAVRLNPLSPEVAGLLQALRASERRARRQSR